MTLPSLLDEETTVPQKTRSREPGLSWHEKIVASTPGKIVFALVVVVVIGFGIFRLIGLANSNAPVYLDVRYMNPTTHAMKWGKVGQKMPDGFYPVEYCFENTCGPEGGTPVVLNLYLGDNSPTFCPKCGAEVSSHNPRPEEYNSTTPADWDN